MGSTQVCTGSGLGCAALHTILLIDSRPRCAVKADCKMAGGQQHAVRVLQVVLCSVLLFETALSHLVNLVKPG